MFMAFLFIIVQRKNDPNVQHQEINMILNKIKNEEDKGIKILYSQY